MIRKLIGVALCLAAIINQAGAQALGIELDGGFQGTHYQLQNGQTKPLPAGSLVLTYTFRLGDRWGLITGFTGGIYRTKATLQDGVIFTTGQVDDVGSAFQYNVKTVGYKEIQSFFGASIPLLLQYHTTEAGMQWYIEGGGRVLFPFSSSIQVSADQLSLSGYYPDYNLDVSNLPQHGFGTIDGWKSSASSEIKSVAAALTAATGVSFSLSPGKRLYTGLYVDYGLTDLKEKNGDMPLVTYSSTGLNGVQANSVLNMQNAGQVTLLSFGLQVRLSFESTKTKKPVQPAKSIISGEEIAVIQKPVIFGILGETSVPEVQKPHLDEVANIMKQYPDIRISIVGHTCNSATETENIKVGVARAKAVARYLRRNGINGSRMHFRSVSASDPVLSFDPAVNFQNRRAVITIE
jgi:OmpA-OmpF porin, OOP family